VTSAGHRLRYWQVVDLGLRPRSRPINNLDDLACPAVTRRPLVCNQQGNGTKSQCNWYLLGCGQWQCVAAEHYGKAAGRPAWWRRRTASAVSSNDCRLPQHGWSSCIDLRCAVRPAGARSASPPDRSVARCLADNARRHRTVWHTPQKRRLPGKWRRLLARDVIYTVYRVRQ